MAALKTERKIRKGFLFFKRELSFHFAIQRNPSL
jgi:hypothetical protein